jgi:LPPG:FO 2-phospho-L-lactate transferase
LKDVEVIALTGGIGGCKLALGLQHIVSAGGLACIVNTGDDFRHLGLHISPDLDTALYTLAGLNDPVQGWGRRDETWTFMRVLADLGAETWFRLGDGDLALHVERTRRLADGETLTAIMNDARRRFGVPSLLLPMSDASVRTVVETDAGTLEFQDYFVRRRAEPRVHAVRYEGARTATTTAQVEAAFASAALRAVVICPSNPLLSIDPLLAVPGLRELLRARRVPLVAVCPLIAGQAIKGPTAKIFDELGLERTPGAIAAHYGELLDGLVIDAQDAEWGRRCGCPTVVTRTLMQTLGDRMELARTTLDFASRLRTSPGSGRSRR